MSFDIMKRLHEMLENENITYHTLAKTLLSYTSYEHLKIKTLENACNVSGPTVIRFCKKMGLSSFSELKFLLTQADEQNKELRIRDNFALSKKANEHFMHIAQSFVDTRDLLSDEQLAQIVKTISDANFINLFAIGSTYFVALDFEQKLNRIKKHAKAHNDINLQYFAACNSDHQTLAVGITYSAKSEPVLNSLRISKKEGAKTLLFTSIENRQFEKEFDMVVYVSSTDMQSRLITTTSRLTFLYIIDLLFYSYVNMNKDEINEILYHSKLYT